MLGTSRASNDYHPAYLDVIPKDSHARTTWSEGSLAPLISDTESAYPEDHMKFPDAVQKRTSIMIAESGPKKALLDAKMLSCGLYLMRMGTLLPLWDWFIIFIPHSPVQISTCLLGLFIDSTFDESPSGSLS